GWEICTSCRLATPWSVTYITGPFGGLMVDCAAGMCAHWPFSKQRDEQTDRHQGAAQAFADVQPEEGESSRPGQEGEGPQRAARREAVQRGRFGEAHGLRA